MLYKLNQLSKRDNTVKELNESVRLGLPTAIFGVTEGFKSFLVSVIDGPILYVAKDMVSAFSAIKQIKEFSNKTVKYFTPKDHNLGFMHAFSKDGLYERLSVLESVSDIDVIVTTPEALTSIYPKNIQKIILKKGQDYCFNSLIECLTALGYQRVSNVESKGAFSVRGDAIDVFSVNEDQPIRIDFFGDYIENIKKYDIETRKNLGFLTETKIIQACECVFTKAETNEFCNILKLEYEHTKGDKKDKLKTVYFDLINGIENKDVDTLSTFLPLSKNVGTIFDIINKDTTIIFDEEKSTQ